VDDVETQLVCKSLTMYGVRPKLPFTETKRFARFRIFLLALIFSALGLTPSIRAQESVSDKTPIANTKKNNPSKSFRAAWVATVANIDWPSKKGLTSEQQAAEINAIVSRAKQVGLNVLILQVRPSADAIYPSTLEPWSEFLSGTQGLAPQCAKPPCIGWDPLQHWIDTAHAVGIQIHAWFNPYRAGHSQERSPKATNHVSKTLTNAVQSYGDFLWLDPGQVVASEHSLAVIRDVLTRYDIDGVHIDDYFYPYPITPVATDSQDVANPGTIEFPDELSWQAYVIGGGTLSRQDWRRNNVNQFVQRLHEMIKSVKPKVQLGISPFGLGKPSLRPANIKGFSQYDALYADVELWLTQGWLDYLAPQLYWKRDAANQAFEPLLDYWISQNAKSKQIYSGLFTSRLLAGTGAQAWPSEEIIEQLKIIDRKRKTVNHINGHIHFSMKAIMQNTDGIADKLQRYFAEVDALQLNQ
jgi:uncharacterized lipoprotein YddW (UPF0748 family)